MRQFPRVLVQHINKDDEVSLEWCDIELNLDDRVELISRAQTHHDPALLKKTDWTTKKVNTDETLKLIVFDPNAAEGDADAFYILFIHKKNIYQFTYKKFGFNHASTWNGSLSSPWQRVTPTLNGYKPPYNLTNDDHHALNRLKETNLQHIREQYLAWFSTPLLWLHIDEKSFYPELDRATAQAILESDFYFLLHQLKSAAISSEQYCLILIALLNRKYKPPRDLDEASKNNIECIHYDFFHGKIISSLGITDPDVRANAYYFIANLLWEELIKYREGVENSSIQAFSKQNIEPCHYPTKLGSLHRSGMFDDNANKLSPIIIAHNLQRIYHSPQKHIELLNTLLEKTSNLELILYDELLLKNPRFKRWALEAIALSPWLNSHEKLLELLELSLSNDRDVIIASMPKKKLEGYLQDKQKADVLFKLAPNNGHLWIIKLKQLIDHEKNPSVRHHALHVLSILTRLHRKKNSHYPINTLLQQTCELLESPPGHNRQRLAAKYIHTGKQLQVHQNKHWRRLGIAMLALGGSIIILSLTHLAPIEIIAGGATLCLSSVGFFAKANQPSKLNASMSQLSEAVTSADPR